MKVLLLLLVLCFAWTRSAPTSQPSSKPSSQPSLQPSSQPSSQPSLQPSLYPTSQPSSQPTSPTIAPTVASVPTSSPTPVQLSVVQTLIGISASNFDSSAQSVFKTAVASVLSSYSITSSDVTITSYSDARRVLYDIQSRILSSTLQVSYTINFNAQSSGYTSSSSAATAVTNTLTAAVQSSTFNSALSAAAISAGNSQMQSVTSSSSIVITNTTPSSSSSKKDTIDKDAAIGGSIGGFFGALFFTLIGLHFYKQKYSKYPWEKAEKSKNFSSLNQNPDTEVVMEANPAGNDNRM